MREKLHRQSCYDTSFTGSAVEFLDGTGGGSADLGRFFCTRCGGGMSAFSFRGGPWNGFIIEYAEDTCPDDTLNPATTAQPDLGLYQLNDLATEYVWASLTSLRSAR